ncbi:MAG: MJ0042-type zinc finger domain-containing protein [Phycisphaeraceae bacterium]
MITTCTHCGAQYKLPDKMLGKQARCKACNKLFVLVPTEDEVELPEPTGSTTRMNPVKSEQVFQDDPAEAIDPSSRSRSRREDDDDEPRGRRRMAKGAKTAMGLGITACVFAAAGLTLMIIGMANADSQSLIITLGIISLGSLAVAAVLGMIAVANGTSAKSKILRARHPLAGKSEACTGSLTGGIALAVVLICVVTIIVFLARRGGIKFEKEITVPANASLQPAAPTNPNEHLLGPA